MATIYTHGSFLFFVYVCIACLLGILGIADTGITSFWRALFTVTFEILVGAGVTIFFIDRLNDHRATESLKKRLVREAGSRSHDVAISAVEWMEREGWLRGEDGLLRGANLERANFRGGVNLRGANLQGANLQYTVLVSADLSYTDLRGANLIYARLDNTNLFGADLRGANLMYASLDSAQVIGAKLQGAYLLNAKISGPFFGPRQLPDIPIAGVSATQLPPTILPDGTEYDSGMSLEKFTNGKHHDFGQTLAKINEIRRSMGLYTLGNDTQQADCSLTNLDQQSHD